MRAFKQTATFYRVLTKISKRFVIVTDQLVLFLIIVYWQSFLDLPYFRFFVIS